MALLATIAATFAAVDAQGRHRDPAPAESFPRDTAATLDVYIENFDSVSLRTTDQGMSVASNIFQGVGIALRWHAGKPPKEHASNVIAIRIAQAPPSASSKALATAVPSRREIQVYMDRIENTRELRPRLIFTVFGYVLAHEIAHVLQGEARHSESGILKARWYFADYTEMLMGKLRFDSQDVERMWQGPILKPACSEVCNVALIR